MCQHTSEKLVYSNYVLYRVLKA